MDTDRISFLPEHIRDQIICFLPIDDVVRASSLSRNWRSVYSSLSNFVINHAHFKTGTRRYYDFREIINCLLLHHDQSDVQSFKLSVFVDDCVSTHNHVNGWISFAISHNVKDLYIEFFDRLVQPIYLPCSLFNSNSLIELTLVGITLALPTIIALPALKRLSLNSIFMEGYNLAENFFPNCPVLEFLSMVDCKVFQLHIFVPTLKTLIVRDVKFHQMNVRAPNLHWIKYDGSKLPNITPETLSSLHSVEFSFPGEIVGVNFDYHARKIFTGLHNVEKLHLKNKSYIESLSRVPDLKAYLPTSSASLKDLFLHISSTKIHIGVLVSLLESYPCLETLNILVEKHTTSTESSTMERDWQLKDLSTVKTMENLATIKFYSFEGDRVELDLVRYFLQNDKVLQKIYMIYSYDMVKNIEARWRISEELLKFTRASPHATIVCS